MILAKLYKVCDYNTKKGTNEETLVEQFYVSSDKGIYTFSDLSLEYGKQIDTQGTTGNKPISYITALNLVKSGFKIHLDRRFVDIQAKIGMWKGMAENNYLYKLYIGSNAVIPNPVVIESVKVSNIRINGKGIWLSADIDVSIQEFAGNIKNNPAKIGILRKRIADYEDGDTTVSYY